MKKLLLGLLLITGSIAKAQVYNNEWIDYSKTYYKFKVGKTGLYRISQSVLSSSGLGSTPAEYFQLWRNGKQIPIYTTVETGSLSSSDYIEFWGEMNDGKPDKELYRNPSWQLNDKWSLETDTAAYFLTVNTNVSGNLRLVTTANNVSGTTLTPDAYFMYTAGKYFRDRLNPGYAVNVGEYLYSSSYDKGEGYSSPDIVTTFSNCVPNYGVNSFTFSNLNVYNGTSAPAAKFKIALSGNQINQRRFFAKINSDSIISNTVDFFNYTIDSTTFSLNSLNGTNDVVSVYNYTNVYTVGCPVNDRMVVHKYEITYPRTFNFNGQSGFEFTLSANASGNYLQITNFNNGSSTPVLYDLTNGKRYLADLSSAPTLKFVLESSLTARNLVLVNEDAGNINLVTTLQARNFVNYTDASNQGDYIIISSPALFGGSNPVEEYRSYRSSAAGGNYTAKIYLIEEIIDQFGFGIKKNPAAVRDFLRYARTNYGTAPRHVFIIGRGVVYPQQRANESNPDIEKLNLVPTFGNPASDVLLVSEPGSSQPSMSIGRLSAISPAEVSTYLKKVKDFEQVQTTQSPLIKDKAWMKNVVHIVGASDEALDAILSDDLNRYKKIIEDTLFGGNVTSFNKLTPDGVSQLNSSRLNELFSEGISLITYFGHSSATTMEFNLDNPLNYNNYQKYPMFVAMGCNAGAFFNFSTTRLQVKETISENYVLAPDRGTIGFVASTHFGIVHYLNIWAERMYRQAGYKNYGSGFGEILKATAADVFAFTSQEDFYARCNIEQTEYHGDPAIRMNTHSKPDYVIEDSMVKINPSFVSVADNSFNIIANVMNIGKSPNAPVVIEIKRELPPPNQSIVVVRRDTIPGIQYATTMSFNIPIDPTKEKGLNKIIVTIDPDNNIDELFENNNSITKDVMIFEEDARPIYPYNLAIVNKQNIKLIASSANPFASSKTYQLELDTTALFNSPFKVIKSLTQSGGILEFDPGITFTNGVTYYWRVGVSQTSGVLNWNKSSFIYLSNYQTGFNQSHRYQFMESEYNHLIYDSVTNYLKYDSTARNLFVRNAIFPTAATDQADFRVSLNNNTIAGGGCYYNELIISVLNPVTLKLWKNNFSGGTGLYNSLVSTCGPDRGTNFEYLLGTQADRKKIMDFLDLVPDGHYVIIRSNTHPTSGNTYSSTWLQDENSFGTGNSIYSQLLNQGFSAIDSFDRPRSWIFLYKKNRSTDFQPKYIFSNSAYDKISLSVDFSSIDSIGFVTSPVFGPAKAWKEMQWEGTSLETNSSDVAKVNILGYSTAGNVDTLFRNITPAQAITNISSINATQYPYLQLHMSNADNIDFTPYQLRYWRLTYDPVPEGAVAPNMFFSITDTVEIAQPVDYKLMFKNVSDASFDSLKVKMVVTDRNNVAHVLNSFKQRALGSGDTLYIRHAIDTRQLAGHNSLYVEVNPDNDQWEQYHFNNFVYSSFYVRGDTTNPLLDVTFDNVHILNNDIVSSKPNILVKLRDESKWFALDDASVIKVQVKYPDGSLHDYNFGTDTLQFVSASQQVPTNDNSASAVFKPYFAQDGQYELIVSGKDMSQNNAGTMEYHVVFSVFNKPMISNMLNYPNPFTTSTAFVFTLTGSEVPQNIKIEILTVTGKLVREITKDELGPLHIGRNITEFKWDGTDQYGQKLGNGVYLYRVVTNLNGKPLDKFTSKSENTDQYFNKGYGKMYLMR
jgi:hypothetical protein